jgi:transcriptional regulator with XRE-family HTH domain
MQQRPSDVAMRRFVAAAIKAAGKQQNVSALLLELGIVSSRTGRPYSQTGISGWATGRTVDVPAEPLFALAKELGLSMDQFALGRADGQMLDELRAQVAVLWEAEQARREEEGRPPLPEPGQDGLTGDQDLM